MKLYRNCPSCKEDIIIKSDATTRPDLEKSKGEEFVISCEACGTKTKVHVNDVRAKNGYTFLIIAIIVGLAFTLTLWSFLGAVAVASFAFPILAWQSEQKSVSMFNRYSI